MQLNLLRKQINKYNSATGLGLYLFLGPSKTFLRVVNVGHQQRSMANGMALGKKRRVDLWNSSENKLQNKLPLLWNGSSKGTIKTCAQVIPSSFCSSWSWYSSRALAFKHVCCCGSNTSVHVPFISVETIGCNLHQFAIGCLQVVERMQVETAMLPLQKTKEHSTWRPSEQLS